MPRFMLDTDTCSYIMKRSHPLVLKRLQAVHVDDVCMSVITKAELLYSVGGSRPAGLMMPQHSQPSCPTSRSSTSRMKPRITMASSART